MTTIIPESEDHWLQLRLEDITSTESAALFGISPYTTAFELYHRKKDKRIVKRDQTERMKWGLRLEPVIAAGVAEDNGWKAKPLKAYVRHDTQRGMGSSFDWEIVCPKRGPGILEIKNVDNIQYTRGWIPANDENEVEAPEHIELQLQHQLEVKGYSWGVVAALVGGNKPIVIIRDRDREIGAMICAKIEQFWKDIDSGIEPAIDFTKDDRIIKEIYRNAYGDEPIDFTGNNRATELCSIYKKAAADESVAKKTKEIAKLELITIIGKNALAKIGDYKISAKTINRQGYVVDPTSYRDFRITEKKA